MKLIKVAEVTDYEDILAWEEYIREHQEKEKRRKRYFNKKKYKAKKDRKSEF